MKVTDEMVKAACKRMFRWHVWDNEEQAEMRAALEAALDAAPACPHIRSTGEGTHHCALAAAPQAEPVAWRWKAVLDDGRISNWVLTHAEPPPYAVARRPLYATPQPTPDALREALGEKL